MKKLITCSLLVATAFSFAACANQNAPSQGGPSAATLEQIAANPFVTDYQFSETQIKSFTENDSATTIAEAGPFYIGNKEDFQPGLKTFDDLKAALVDQITKSADQLNKDSLAYAADLKNLKNKYIDYLGQTLEVNNKLGKQMKPMAQDIVAPEAAYDANFALYNSLDPAATDNAASQALFKFQRTNLTLQNLLLLSTDTSQTVSGLATLETALQNNSDQKMKDIGTAMEKDIPGMVDSAGDKLLAIQQQGAVLDAMLKQMNTAEYLMGNASVQYIDQTLAALQPKIEGLTAKNGLSADDITLIKELASQYKTFNDQLKSQLAGVDPKELIADLAENNLLFPVAKADEPGYAARAFNFLKSAGQTTLDAGKGLGKLTWNATKGALQTARTVTGVTLDTLSAGTKSGFDVVFGVANGNSVSDIADEIGGNFEKVGENYSKGKSGSEVLQTAKGYFDAAENAGGQALSGAVEKTIGKGWTSWAAGHVGNITVNMFTGFGKGITKLADPQSTTGDIAEGALDVGLSFIGGSKVIATGSQFAKGSKEALQLLGKDGINFVKRVIASGDIKSLKGLSAELLANTKLTPAQVEQLISNSLEIEVKQGIQKELLATAKNLDQEFIKFLKASGTTFGENLVGARQAYIDFVEKAFENSLSGFKDSLVEVLGKDAEAYFNNLVGSKVDDFIKGAAKDYVNSHQIPGVNVAPDLKDLAGPLQNGEMTVTDVVMTDEFKKQAKEQGCDVSQIEDQKGKSTPMKMTMQPTSDSGGNILITGSDGKQQSVPFTYQDGVITGTYSAQGADVNMTMTVTEEGGKYKFSGPMDINYQGGGLQIKANANASKDVPPPPAPAAPVPAK